MATAMTSTLKIQTLNHEDVFSDIARVHLDHRPGTKAGQIILIRANGKKARLVARGSKGSKKNVLTIDLSTRNRLGVKPDDEVEMSISKANFLDEMIWAWHATDAMPRIAARLALLSVLLGIAGAILGGVSLWVASA